MSKSATPTPTNPGAIIRRDYMDPLKLSATRIAAHLGINRNSISRVINKKAGISSGLDLRLSRTFNTSPELKLNLHRKLDLWEGRGKRRGLKKMSLYSPPLRVKYE